MIATAMKPYTRTASTDHSVWHGDSLTTFLATGEDTDGAFAMVEMIAPFGTQPPPHIHTGEAECFYLIEGEVTFLVDGQPIEGRAGTWAFVPQGTPHTFRVESERAKMLVLIVRAGFERFFLEMSTPLRSLDEAPPAVGFDIPHLVATAEKYGCEFLPPAS